jgi:hypothetical protein
MIVFPAYGAIYNSKQEVVEAWSKDADFRIHKGPYISKRDHTNYCPTETVVCLYGVKRDKEVVLE